jgi:hypothetical protein
MTMPSRLSRKLAALAALAVGALPMAATGQTIPYGNVGSGTGAADAPAAPDAPSAGSRGGSAAGNRGARGPGGYGVKVTPYIEAAQLVTSEFSPGNETLTYSELAAGVDASVRGRHNAASMSLRYERDFGWGKAEDQDALSGVANGYATVAPGVEFHAGGLAARTSVENDGSAVLSPLGVGDRLTQIYSVYAGPSVATHAGDVAINADYRFGYTKVNSPNLPVVTPDQQSVDLADEDKVHIADVHAAVKPGVVLPVGLGADATYYREDVSNLDQRVEDFSARGEVTVPVTNTLEAVGGLGYEKVQISSRDAVRDASGNPEIDDEGRFITDESKPRVLAYDTSGLIWDAGVIWRPSRRTAAEAHVGRRYGTVSYYGSFAWAPNPRSSVNISVYDNIAGFGGQLTRSLIALPTDFEAVRNPLDGSIGGCVASLEGGSCLSNALGSLRSSTFRARGVMATYGIEFGRLSAGIGAGYDRRKFIGAPGTILALSNGVIDENYWLSGYLSAKLDRRSGVRADLYANWFRSGSDLTGDETAFGATASYYRNLTEHLSAIAALGLNGVTREAPLPDDWVGSGLVGVRYSF